MQVFKAFMKILKKKLPSSLAYLSALVALSIIMTGTGSTENMFESSTITMCIFDEDGTEESRALAEFLGQTQEIVEIENDKDTIIDSMYYMTTDYVLVINKGYSEKLGNGETEELFGSYKMHDSYSTVFMGQLLNEYVSAVNAYTAGGESLADAIKSAEEALSQQTEVTMASFEGNDVSEFPERSAYYFKFLAYVFISVIISVLSPVLLVIDRKDIRFRTNCSSVKPSSYTLQIFAGSAVFIIGLWLVFMAVGLIFYGGIYQGRAWLAVLNGFIFALVSASVAILISSFLPDIRLVTLVTQIVGLGMAFLCGVFVDQWMLGEGVLAAARFLPAYWYIKVNDMLAGKEIFDSSKLAVYMAVEMLFAVAFALITAHIRKLKYNEAAVPAAEDIKAEPV